MEQPSLFGGVMPEQQPMVPLQEASNIPPIEEQNELVDRIRSQYDAFQSAVKPYHDLLKEWHTLYEAQRPAEKEFPWEGSSNYSVPLIRSTIDSMQSRISKSVFEVDPLWLTRARTSGATDVAKKAEMYLDYWADTIDLPRSLDTMIQGMLIEGVGVIKVDWLREYGPAGVDEMGNATPAALTYDAPGTSYVPAKDFIMMPADSPTIDDATYVGHRVYLSHMQLEARRDSGAYFNVDELFEVAKGNRKIDRSVSPSSPIVNSNVGNSKYPEANMYELLEIYGPYDFGSGPQPAVMTIAADHRILLRVEPYAYMYGKAPYVDFCILPRPNFFWGYSFAEILASSQEELTALHNARADALALSIAPPILRRHGAEWDADTAVFQPGAVFNVADPSEIVFMQVPAVSPQAFSHEADILAFVERTTGLSDYHMGRNASMGRTATEVNRVTSEGLARLDTMISRFQHGGMKKLGWMLWWLLYQFRPFMDFFYKDGQEYSLTTPEKGPTDNGMMSFELHPHGILSDVSKEARRQQKLMLFNTAAPMLAQFYPDGIQEMLIDLLQDFEVKDSERLLGPPWSVIQQQMQQAMQQGHAQGMQEGAAQVMQQIQNASQQ